jgi:hypothetical protein
VGPLHYRESPKKVTASLLILLLYVYILGDNNPTQYSIIFSGNAVDSCAVCMSSVRSVQNVVHPDCRNKSKSNIIFNIEYDAPNQNPYFFIKFSLSHNLWQNRVIEVELWKGEDGTLTFFLSRLLV